MAAFVDDPAAAGYSKREILLAKAGWIKPNLRANDNRQVAPLNPTMTLHQVRKRLSSRPGAKGAGSRVNWGNKDGAEPNEKNKFQQEDGNTKKKSLREMVMKKPPQAEDSSATSNSSVSTPDAAYKSHVEQRFVDNVMSDVALGGPAAASARNNLLQKNPALLAKMMARMDKEEKKAEMRGRKLNSMGILDEEVNDVRNRNMQRVSLRKGLTGAALAKEEAPTVDPLAGVVSLEERLSELLEVVTLVVDGPPSNESKSMFDTNLAGAAARMVMAQRQGVTPARQHELEAITSKALGRYRQRVHEEQVKLLEELGLNLQQPDSWVDTLEQREEQRLEVEAKAEMTLSSNTAANTEELMDAVLDRLSQIEERVAAHEEIVKQQEAAQDGSEEDSEVELQDHSGGYDPRAHTTAGHSSTQQLSAERSQTSVQKSEEEAETTDPFDDGVRPRKLPDNWAPGGLLSTSQSSMRRGKSMRAERSRSTALGVTADGSHPGPSGHGGATFYFPDDDELDSAPAPALPPVMQLGGMTPADVLQARLERIWGLLEMPMMGKLDMVIKYTAKELSPQLEEALEIWESGAASVVERERLLSMMVDIQESMDSGTIAKSIVNKKSVSEVCMGFLYMSYNARRADDLLRSGFQDCLTYQGLEYPGEDAVTDDQLEIFVQRAFDMSVQLSPGVLM